jgi:predicted permease
VLLFTAAVAVVTGILFGLAPAWHVFTSAPAVSLKDTGTIGETRRRRLFGKALVVAQVALSVVLLGGAGLFAAHLSNLRNVDLGFERDSVLLVTLDPRGAGFNRYQLTGIYRDLLGRLEAIPGVRSATVSGVTPIEGPGASRFVRVDGFQEPPEARRYVSLNWVAPHYFATFGTPLVAGRDFDLQDATRPRVAIVNQAMARHYFAGRSAIGQRFTFDGQDMPYEIVGVVGDAKYIDLTRPAPQTIYLHTFQEGAVQSQFALRTSVRPTAVAAAVLRVVGEAATPVRVAKVTTLSDQLDASIVPQRLMAMLSGFFGGLAALLAALGLYGLLAYTVARRRGEIGVRMALGATRGDVTRMVVKGALALVCAGLAAGVPIAVWSVRLASRLLESLAVGAAAPIAAAAAAMLAVGLLAAYVPARRAARVRPMDALRQEH